ncbi:MAG: energy-dependent translational throttle protein EttA [Acidimicrobiales bacterium]
MNNAQFIFTMRHVGRFHPPDRDVLKDISLSFYPGAKIGVIGHNGSGKSTLLRIMAGIDDEFTGEARLTPGFSVGFLAQEPQLDETKDVYGNVMDGLGPVRDLLANYDAVMAKWAEPDADYDKIGAEQAELEARIEAAGAWDLTRTIEIAMDALRLPPPDAGVTTLSGGERRRVALCRLLLSKPDLLLLDEPTNHLDAESVAWLERTLQDYPGTVVAITHDRYFLDNVARWILELDHGRGIPFEGNYSSWLEQKQERLRREERGNEGRKRMLERELEWVRMAPRARQAKGKARLANYDKLLAEAQEAERNNEKLEISIPCGNRLGDVVMETNHLTKGYGDKLLIDDLTFSLPPAGIVGVIGPNGAGKTTMFGLVGGGVRPDAGRILFDGRDVTALPPHRRCRAGIGRTYQIPQPFVDMTVYENVLVGAVFGAGLSEAKAERRCLEILELTGLVAKANTRAGALTLLERKRLELARALSTGPQLLLLDEIGGGLTEHECTALVATIRAIHATGVSIIWIEHIVHALVAVVSRLIVVNFGRKIADGPPGQVMASAEVRAIYLGIAADA